MQTYFALGLQINLKKYNIVEKICEISINFCFMYKNVFIGIH